MNHFKSVYVRLFYGNSKNTYSQINRYVFFRVIELRIDEVSLISEKKVNRDERMEIILIITCFNFISRRGSLYFGNILSYHVAFLTDSIVKWIHTEITTEKLEKREMHANLQ